MRLIHLSDLHFGTEELRLHETLLRTIQAQKPDMVIISGDFTQHASKREFISAREFMNALEAPVFCVPGNHDIPGLNIFQRFMNPYGRYKQHISPVLEPVTRSEHAIIAGLNTTRPALPHWNWANGRVCHAQLDELQNIFQSPDRRWRVCVFHHPVHKVQEMPLNVTVFGAKKTIAAMHALQVDLVLTGHVHHASIATRGDTKHQTVYVSASTALSHRLRVQENGFNVIDIAHDHFTVNIYKYINFRFQECESFTQNRVH